jgi:hypothetical protein
MWKETDGISRVEGQERTNAGIDGKRRKGSVKPENRRERRKKN